MEENNKLVEKYNSIGAAYSALGNVYFELARATELEDAERVQQLKKELPAHQQILQARTE